LTAFVSIAVLGIFIYSNLLFFLTNHTLTRLSYLFSAQPILQSGESWTRQEECLLLSLSLVGSRGEAAIDSTRYTAAAGAVTTN
jgi:hypothetical protein